MAANLSWKQITTCIFGKTSKPSARIERWVLRLQCHDYKVVYRPGKTNIADALPRMNRCNSKDLSSEKEDIIRFVPTEATPVVLTTGEIERESELDPELQSVRYYIENGDWTNCKLMEYTCIKNELCTIGKLVMRGDRIVIPNTLRKRVLEAAHEGHHMNSKRPIVLPPCSKAADYKYPESGS